MAYVNYLSNSQGSTINPATEEGLAEISQALAADNAELSQALSQVKSAGAADQAELSQALSQVKSTLALGLDRTSGSGGTQKVTLSGGAAQASAQACRACLVKPDPDNTAVVRINIGSAADANDGPMDSFWTPMPVDNLSDLYFYSTDTDAIVYILWRD